jgi:hypothetical protein
MDLRTELFAGAFAGLAACATGCGSASTSAPPAPRVFVGEVTGSDARVGVVATDHSARVFFCGGDTSVATMTRWFPSVPIDATRGDLAPLGATGGWSIAGQVDDTGVSGSVTVAGGPVFSFHADPVTTGTIAGLYEAPGPCGKVGLIVAQGSASEAPVGQGACVPASGGASPEQVNPIHPIERAGDGTIAVEVEGAQLPVHAAAAPL